MPQRFVRMTIKSNGRQFDAPAIRLPDLYRRRTQPAPSGLLWLNAARRRRRRAHLRERALFVGYLLAERLAEQPRSLSADADRQRPGDLDAIVQSLHDGPGVVLDQGF